jgi:hypothetical protein
VEQHKRLSLFCTFLINSRDFELDMERSGLILDGLDQNAETQQITESGINRSILDEAQTLFRYVI